ncbi:MAG: UDP-N-acetylglucosamine--N-acetylmuramyl-(pentapeptide) pyrophosphoryl-undecaprenol N-acetylglucosamine transferase [Pedosphaera sp.]|nr:UDP-N-acetylglucosamine--N-acetylmuramyl-(pentapeptide) pyrophosphoryl-undecaprenol N-acetylglucosamine transferase [Pedosphaera sp.]
MPTPNPFVVIACGGTGGHLFPGIAIAEALQQKACDIALIVSPKEVDQEAVKSATGFEVRTLPTIALQDGNWTAFLRGCWASYRICARGFKARQPDAVLAMGGFTSAPPILAGRFAGAATFLHESNAIPGRANRWLAPLVDQIFVGFQLAARRLRNQTVKVVGTPVRPAFSPLETGACRMALGLNPAKPVLLVMGGSQGASGINDLLRQALPSLSARLPELQFVHLTGSSDKEKVAADYALHKRRVAVFPFLTEMELALGAATIALSRSGASSLAEFAAMRLPAILIPFPSAADNHQFYNARAFAETGAAVQLDQSSVTLEKLTDQIVLLIEDTKARVAVTSALERWHYPDAAEEVAKSILRRLGVADVGPSVHKPEDSKSLGSSSLKKPPGREVNPQLCLSRSNL